MNHREGGETNEITKACQQSRADQDTLNIVYPHERDQSKSLDKGTKGTEQHAGRYSRSGRGVESHRVVCERSGRAVRCDEGCDEKAASERARKA